MSHRVCEPKGVTVTAPSVQAGWAQVQRESGVLPEGGERTKTTLPSLQPSAWVSSSPSCLPRAVEIHTSAQKNEPLAVSSMVTGPANQALGLPQPPPGQSVGPQGLDQRGPREGSV